MGRWTRPLSTRALERTHAVNAQYFVYDSAEEDDAHLIGRYRNRKHVWEYAAFHRSSVGSVTNHHWGCRGSLIDDTGKMLQQNMAGCTHCNGLGLMLHEGTNDFSFQCSSDGGPSVGLNIDNGRNAGSRSPWSNHVMGEGRMGQGNVHRTNFAATAPCGEDAICAVIRHTEVPYGERGQNVWFVKWNTTSKSTVGDTPKQLTSNDKFGPLKLMRLVRFGDHLLMGWQEGNKWFKDMFVRSLTRSCKRWRAQ